MLGYPPHQENVSSNTVANKFPSEEDRLAVTELLNKKQALMVELQHYEANAASFNQEPEMSNTAMPTNTRLQVAVAADTEEVNNSTILFIHIHIIL